VLSEGQATKCHRPKSKGQMLMQQGSMIVLCFDEQQVLLFFGVIFLL